MSSEARNVKKDHRPYLSLPCCCIRPVMGPCAMRPVPPGLNDVSVIKSLLPISSMCCCPNADFAASRNLLRTVYCFVSLLCSQNP